MRKALIAIAVLAGIITVTVSYGAIQAAVAFISHDTVNTWLLLLLAVAIQLVGHVLRAERTKLILDQAAPSSSRFQFGMLSVGYLFNAILPFRIGELVRSLLVARRLRISLSYTFTSVVIERMIDVIFLSILIICGALLLSGEVITQAALIAAGVVVVALFILAGLGLLVRENRQLLTIVWKVSGWFNPSINNNIRFKVWSLIFGLQHFLSNAALVRRYASFALISWLLYFASVSLVIAAIFDNVGSLEAFVATVASYVISVPVWGVLDSGNYGFLQTLLPSQSMQDISEYGLILWVILVVPMAFIGLVTLLVYKVEREDSAPSQGSLAFSNKLSRQQDISQEFPAFLDSYFSGNSLARILHRLEATNDLRLVKFFKGGSDAITILVLSNDELFVKKIIPVVYENRLKAQYNWLKKHKKMPHLVQILGEQKTSDYYAIDLAYDPENIPLFEFIHHNSVAESERVVEATWKTIYGELYRKATKPKIDTKARDTFVEKHIYSCLEKAQESNSDLARVVDAETIIINGKEYDNFFQIMEKIKNHKQAWQDIATFSHGDEVHGDMAIDNVLVSPRTKKPVIIDPAPDGNVINGPVFDFGKLSQSFYCGYEFLFRDNEGVTLDGHNTINYREHISARYTKLWHYVHDNLAPQYLSESERRAMLFHAAALHIRVLKHRVYINPDNVLKFYAVGVKTLNDFLDQYEK